MIVKEITNRKDIEAILKRPEIYDAISDDNTIEAKNFKAPINKDYKYIGGYLNNEIIALMIYHTYRDGNECHVQVLPEYRKQYALEFGEQSLLFSGTQPLYAEIPSCYSNVLKFAKHFGFNIIKVKALDYLKNEKKYDTCVLRYK